MTKKQIKALYWKLHQKWYDKKSTKAEDIILIDKAQKFILEAMSKVNDSI